ncbi:MAG: hypothetical protein LBF86_09400, partial [Helicobacteraceae bacterium]|nr:hypothetical protein [Helicobacteraceae bacterium]
MLDILSITLWKKMSLTQPFNLIDLITPKNAPRAEAKTAILSSEQSADVNFALTLKKRIAFSGAAKQILTSAEAIKATVAIKSVQTAIGDQNETKATDGASRGFEQTPIAQNETSGQTLIAAKEPPIKPLGALAPQNQAGESDAVWVKEIEAVLAAANDETPQTLAANANKAKPPQAAIAAFEADESARAAIARLNQNANASAVQTLYSVERRFRAIGRQGTLTELVEFANKNDLAIAKISLVKTNAPASQSAPLTKPIESPTQKTANTPREINAPIKTEKAAQALNVLTAKTQTTANRSNEIADKTPRLETNAKTPVEPATDQKIENKPTISVINEKTANQTIKTAQA